MYTNDYLLSEARRLIDQYNETNDPTTRKEIDGCFQAVQEVILAKHVREQRRKVVADNAG